MQGDLPLLIELQKKDLAVDAIQRDADALGPQIQSIQKKIDGLKNTIKTSKEQLTQYQLKKKQLELDVDAKEKLVQKHNSELNSLKSNDAYKSMMEEIKGAKEAVVKIEDEILAVMEGIDTEDKKVKEAEKTAKAQEGTLLAQIKTIESERAALLEKAQTQKAQRDEFAKTLPRPLLERYDVIREKGDGVAIVPMENATCGGCNMKMSPAKANDVKKAKDMVLCDSCTRILYIPAAVVTEPIVPTPPEAVSPTTPTA
jgi:predicted  nucleic acid-binding Zn-ribbon protein